MSIKGEGRLPPLQTKKTQGIIWCCPFREVVIVDIRGGGWWFMYVHNPKSLCFLEELLQYLCNWIKTFLVPDLSFQSIPVVLSWQLGEPSCPRSHPFLDCLSASPEIISSFNRWGKKFPVALYEKGLLKHSKHCQGHNWDMDWVLFLFRVFYLNQKLKVRFFMLCLIWQVWWVRFGWAKIIL